MKNFDNEDNKNLDLKYNQIEQLIIYIFISLFLLALIAALVYLELILAVVILANIHEGLENEILFLLVLFLIFLIVKFFIKKLKVIAQSYALFFKAIFMMIYKFFTNKFVIYTIVLAVLFAVFFVRIVPDYSVKYGFAVVSTFDKAKYDQGYCLAENRILSKEELYKRAIGEYLQKELEVDKKIDKWRAYNYGSSWESETEIGYYELADDINLDNWLEKIKNNYMDLYFSVEKTNYSLDAIEKAVSELLFNKLKIRKINPINHIKINFNNFGNITAGFDKPILYIEHGLYKSQVLLDNFIIFKNDKLFDGYYFYFYYGFGRSDDLIKYDKEKEKRELQESRSTISKFNYYRKIDNCGSINYDIEDMFIRYREARGG